MKKSTALFVSALAMATAAYAQNPQSTVSTKENTTMTAQVQINNIRNAQALINTFVSGDSAKARSLLAPNYIQHNLNYATGADAFVGAVDYLATAPTKTTVKTVRGVPLQMATKCFCTISITSQAVASKWHLTSSALIKTEKLQNIGTI